MTVWLGRWLVFAVVVVVYYYTCIIIPKQPVEYVVVCSVHVCEVKTVIYWLMLTSIVWNYRHRQIHVLTLNSSKIKTYKKGRADTTSDTRELAIHTTSCTNFQNLGTYVCASACGLLFLLYDCT